MTWQRSEADPEESKYEKGESEEGKRAQGSHALELTSHDVATIDRSHAEPGPRKIQLIFVFF
jgi:hypothetical protein